MWWTQRQAVVTKHSCDSDLCQDPVLPRVFLAHSLCLRDENIRKNEKKNKVELKKLGKANTLHVFICGFVSICTWVSHQISKAPALVKPIRKQLRAERLREKLRSSWTMSWQNPACNQDMFYFELKKGIFYFKRKEKFWWICLCSWVVTISCSLILNCLFLPFFPPKIGLNIFAAGFFFKSIHIYFMKKQLLNVL